MPFLYGEIFVGRLATAATTVAGAAALATVTAFATAVSTVAVTTISLKIYF